MDIVKTVAEAIEAIPGNPSSREIARIAIEEYQRALWTPMFGGPPSRTVFPEFRRNRANALTAQIMHLIGKYLCRHGEEDGAREVSRTLFDTFYETGAEVITDVDRKMAGLDARGPYGLTPEELRYLEARHIAAMLSPMPPTIITREDFLPDGFGQKSGKP
jgi:hypothetical protein